MISLEHCVFFTDFTYDSVCGKDNDKSDDGLIEAGCCRHSDISGFHQTAVYVGINNIGCRVQKSRITRHLIEQTEIRIEDTADTHQCQGDHSWFQEWKCNVFDLLPFGCAIQRSCLIQRRVNAVDGRYVDQTSISYTFPGIYKDQDERPVFRFRIPVHSIFSKCA